MCWAGDHGRLKVTAPTVDAQVPQAMPQPKSVYLHRAPIAQVTRAGQRVPSQMRGRKRCRKVLYPPVVRRYLPAEEKCQVQRLLFLLLGVIFFQVYTASENQEDPLVPCSVPETRAEAYPSVKEKLEQPEDHWQMEDLSMVSMAQGQTQILASKSECTVSGHDWALAREILRQEGSTTSGAGLQKDFVFHRHKVQRENFFL